MTRDPGTAEPPTREDFERAVEEALAAVPEDIVARVDNVFFVVEERDPSGEGLLGLYEGISLAERGADYAGVLPDRISIYIDGHLDLNLDPDATLTEVRRTVWHELGHHLGIDDDRLEELDYQ